MKFPLVPNSGLGTHLDAKLQLGKRDVTSGIVGC